MQKRQYPPEEPRKKKKSGKRIIVLLVVLFTVAGLGSAGYGLFHYFFSLMGRLDEPLLPEADQAPGVSSTIVPRQTIVPAEEKISEAEKQAEIQVESELEQNLRNMESSSELYDTNTFNVLLIGVDDRDDTMSGRSDCMVLFSVDKKSKNITMTSFLRDIYLAIPGCWSDRLNAAYVYGGAGLLKDTIQSNFGIHVDRCVTVNFYLVMDAVDALGGIELDLTAEEIGVMNSYVQGQNSLLGKTADLHMLPEEDGTYHVNGNQALAYARIRYIGSDFARTARQRNVISRCMEKVKGLSLRQMTSLAKEFLPRVSTDLTEADCASLLLMLPNLSRYKVQSMTIPQDGTWSDATIRGMMVLTIDFAANSQAWNDMVTNGNQS